MECVLNQPTLHGAISGRTDTFEPFYLREYAGVVRSVYGLTGRWSLAEEVAQEAMLAAFRRWEVVAVMDRPDLWVRRVALNRAISLHRRFVSEARALVRVRGLHSEVHWDAEEDQELWAQVRRLPRTQAAAVVLAAVEQRTAAEIAVVLKCSPETARTHLRRGRDRLAQLVKEDPDE